LHKPNKKPVLSAGSGVAIGIGVGTAIGVATGQIGMWLSIGIATGFLVATILHRRQR
jgi:hypothetical protein